MTWSDLEKVWWLIGVLSAIIVTLWRLAIRTNKSKERLEQVATNKEAITALQGEMKELKEDISDIKDGVERQSTDTAAILGALQSIMLALNDPACNITLARDKFNEYLARR